MKTYSPKPSEAPPAWHVLDAADQPLGRLATRAAVLLRGKHKPQFAPNLNLGDFVIIVNAERVRVSGNKTEGKIYYRHTQYPGGLRQQNFRQLMEKHPTRAVEKAIKGMLPHNRLGRRVFTRLKVYAGPEHPHQAQLASNGTPAARGPSRDTRAAVPASPVSTAPVVDALPPPVEETLISPFTVESSMPPAAAIEESSTPPVGVDEEPPMPRRDTAGE